MPEVHVHPEIVLIAVERCSGFQFEDFVNSFYPALYGEEFVPLGGVKDGGADAMMRPVLENAVNPSHFLQSSIQEDSRSKIRQTVGRLREVGRDVKSLTYFTSRLVPLLDRVEQELGTELGVNLRIRDRQYILAHVNDSPQSRAAFQDHLSPAIEFLRHLGAAPIIGRSEHVRSPEVYVFLRQEVERRTGDMALVEAVTDSLILWALEGTDPDRGILMSREEIGRKILESVPSSKELLQDLFDRRLELLSNKAVYPQRLVRWHKKEDRFCLPYETRRNLIENNTQDEALRVMVLDQFRATIDEVAEGALDPEKIGGAADCAMRSVQLAFESRGLEFCHFLEAREEAEPPSTIADNTVAAMEEARIDQAERDLMGPAIIEALRRSFYASTPEQRLYFGKLARTYSLLFMLRTEPRLLEYFQRMTADFRLYVGTDIIIRALSERFLAPEDQMTRNMLAVARQAGAILVLAEPVLEEVITHLRSTDHEFENYFRATEEHITPDIARQSSRILIRTYFYAKHNPESKVRPENWPGFINQFVSYGELHRPTGKAEAKNYMEAQFGMIFESTEHLKTLISANEVAAVAALLEADKRDRRLAANDALMAHAVYGKRKELRETAEVSEFGLRTWWLTSETSILKYTPHLVARNHNARYMMRPEFLLNFIALAPSTAEARRAFRQIFPTMLGIRLARRMDEGAFHKIMESVKEAESLEEGRRTAVISRLADRLKSDFHRQYTRPWKDERSSDAKGPTPLA